MNLHTYLSRQIPVLVISGRFDAHTVPKLRQWLEGDSSQHLVVDLSQVDFLDSTALATLVQGMKQYRNRQGDLMLVGLQAPVRVIFNLTRLDKAFRIFPDVATAVSTLITAG